jgi:hypothetical protein
MHALENLQMFRVAPYILRHMLRRRLCACQPWAEKSLVCKARSSQAQSSFPPLRWSAQRAEYLVVNHQRGRRHHPVGNGVIGHLEYLCFAAEIG